MGEPLLDWIGAAAVQSAHALFNVGGVLVFGAAGFFLLALLLRGRDALSDALRVLPETRTNLALAAFNAIALAPVFAMLAVGLDTLAGVAAWRAPLSAFWNNLPAALVWPAAVIAGDFTGYWRHRLEHVRWLWPSHAVHHSDTDMTWLTLHRFHPVNRLTTYGIDTGVLVLLGFPTEAVIVNLMVRQYYGMFIHARLDWHYGALGRIFVSPVMHRWHHACDRRAYNANFATVFSLWDQAFGTYFVPGPVTAATGVDHSMGAGLAGQLGYALSPRAYGRPAAPPAARETGRA
ncbi:MAG: sterol desaturase family protein [Oceanicaulis sp.]